MGKVSRSFVVILAALGLAVASLAGTSFAESSASKVAKKKAAIATLAVENPSVSVKKKGSEDFVPATNGQKLRQGDTVQTDATGLATVNYTDSAYTRLDVSTTFKIEKLTEDKGARQIKGSLDTGRTWNRTEALTESGSFEQSGAGATAAVVGTAFSMECKLLPEPDPSIEPKKECSFLGVYHQIILTSDETGEIRDIPEFGECTSVDADLCDEVHQLTPDEIATIAWVQLNLGRDLIEHNFGPGPILKSFDVTVVNGQVVEVVQTAGTPIPITTATSGPTSSSSTSSTTTTAATLPPPPPPPPPGLPQVNVQSGGSNGTGEGDPGIDVPTGPASRITTEDEVGTDNPVIFTVNLTGPEGDSLKVKFTELPDGSFGVIQWFDGETWQPVVTETNYDGATQYRFVPQEYEPASACQNTETTSPQDFASCYTNAETYPANVQNNEDGTVTWTTSFTIQAVDETTGLSSPSVTVPIDIIDDICSEYENRIACDVITTTTIGNLSVVSVNATVTTQGNTPDTTPATQATEPPTSADTTPPPAPDTAPPTSEDTTTTTSGSDG